MSIPRTKTLFSIALTLMLSSIILMTAVPATEAAIEFDTFAYMMVAPNPVGVGQTVLVTFQIDKVNPLATIRANLWQGSTVKITRPDNTVETKGPFSLYSMSSNWFTYTPTQTGTYKFQGNFPGQWVNGTFRDLITGGMVTQQRWYKPSTSQEFQLTVQQEAIQNFPDYPLPTGYWTRPIYGENKGWFTIADNWLMQGYDYGSRSISLIFDGCAFAPYASAPNSPHILWTQPITFGGEVGGGFGDETFYTGLSYEQFYRSPLILGGRIWYTEHTSSSAQTLGTRCLDLYTGKEIYYLNNTAITFLQILDAESPNEHGPLAYAWSTAGSATNGTWQMYDAFTGRWILTVTNITATMTSQAATGLTSYGPKGEILAYTLDAAKNRLILWNSTRAIGGASIIDTWSPQIGSMIDGNRGIEWNVSIPDVPGNQQLWSMGDGYTGQYSLMGLRNASLGDGYLLAQFTDNSKYPYTYEVMAYPAMLDKDANGNYPDSVNHLWINNITDIYGVYARRARNVASGVFVIYDESTMKFHGYSLKNGQQIWVTDPLTSGGWAYYIYDMHFAYGKFYEAGYDGHVRAFEAQTGNLVWDYYKGSAGFENAYGTYPSYSGFTIADHKIYVATDEHSPDSVLWRGGKEYVIDAETGQSVWNMSGWLDYASIADGIFSAFNAMDGQIYTIGKGPSATTISAPQTGITVSSSITLSGTVTDQSPGQKDTPAISDEDQAAWMEYLHMQKPFPTNAKGVTVHLSAIDPNGNTQTIGDAISDTNGNFGISWAAPVPGLYKIIAKFDGTNSYGGSTASAYMTVIASPSAVPVETATPTFTPASPTQTPIATLSPTPAITSAPSVGGGPNTALYVAIAAVVIIAVITAVAVVLRRRK